MSTDQEEQKDSLVHPKEFFQEYAGKNGHGFLCWHDGGEECLRTERSRIMERDRRLR